MPSYGKYRARVVDNDDPLGRLRLRIEFLGAPLPAGWAEASLAAHGPWGQVTLPPIGAGVWVEFEEGNPDKPVYTGRIVDASVPAAAAAQGLSRSSGPR